MVKLNLSQMYRDIEELKRGGGGGGTSDYNKLNNKPTINDEAVQGEIAGKIDRVVNNNTLIKGMDSAIKSVSVTVNSHTASISGINHALSEIQGVDARQDAKIDSLDTRVTDLEDAPSSSHTYSITEQVVGTWIDGRPVYEKTYVGRYGNMDIIDTIYGLDLIIFNNGNFIDQYGDIVPFPFNDNQGNFCLCFCYNNELKLACASGYATSISIRYVKVGE